MHGPLWFLHGSHHAPRKSWFELNDLFGLFFAVPSIALIYLGTHGQPVLLWVGLGMTAYGACYFFFHDILVHRRVPINYRPKRGYLHRIVMAHYMHHSRRTRKGSVSFGFLYAPPLDKLKRQQKAVA
jgi:beta-carotene 3-hydroxylase